MNKRVFIFIAAVILLSLSFGPVLSVAHATEDKFGGLGLKVAQIYEQETENHMGSLIVLDVLNETPASKSGIQKGDVITHIDGEPTKGKTFKYLILEKLRGEIGSKINITIERSGVKTPLKFSLARIEIIYSPEQKG
jgi:C-terminal processing protease CtpA/Prc